MNLENNTLSKYRRDDVLWLFVFNFELIPTRKKVSNDSRYMKSNRNVVRLNSFVR